MTPGFPRADEFSLLGTSAAMRRVREQIATLAALPWHVRVEGATGTGKGIAARLLHNLSARSRNPFVICSLAMLPDNLELSELVGHRRGAFTGAFEDRAGAFELAHTGTCFLDEVGTASPKAQQFLLRLVDEGITRRLGEYRDRAVDVRLVLATNVELEDRVARMGVLVLRMPMLAEHAEDIPELVEHLLTQKCYEAGVTVPPLGSEAMARLMEFPWSRNVRELGKTLEHYVAFGKLPDSIARAPRVPDWRDRIEEVLRQHGGNRARAAKALGVSRNSLYEELQRRRA